MRSDPGRPARAAVALLALALASAAPAQERGHGQHGGPDGARAETPGVSRAGFSYANPSAVIAAELALARDAAARGETAALAAAAAPEAVVATPALAWAQAWFKGQANAPLATERQTQAVWASCDGSLAVSRGTWHRGAAGGWYASVWQRQPDGSWKWLVREEAPASALPPAPDMLEAHVADCPARRAGEDKAGEHKRDESRRKGKGKGKGKAGPRPEKLRNLPPLDPAHRAGASPDGSLRWDLAIVPGREPALTVRWQRDGGEADVPVLAQDPAPMG